MGKYALKLFIWNQVGKEPDNSGVRISALTGSFFGFNEKVNNPHRYFQF